MEPLLFAAALVALAGVAGSAIAIARFAERSIKDQPSEADVRRDVAVALGLSQNSASNPTILTGAREGRPVNLVWQQVSDSWFATGVTTVMVGGLPRGLRLGPDQAVDHLGRVETGDRTFDVAFRPAGDPEVVLAALTHAVRTRLYEQAQHEDQGVLAVRQGAVQVRFRGQLMEVAALRGALDLAGEIAGLVDPTDEIEKRLAVSALSDPVPEMRLQCLSALLQDYRGALSEATARRAIEQDDPEIRLESARYLGDTDVLESLMQDEHAVPAVRCEALCLLVQLQERGEAVAHLRWALRTRHWHLQRDALELTRELEAAELAEDVHEVVAWAMGLGQSERRGHERNLLEAARTATVLGGPTSEMTLILLLQSPSNPTQLEAARGLGESGSVRAVEPLMALQDRSYPELHRAAKDAVRTIQARAGDAGAGALSLSEDDSPAGALSLSEDKP